MVLQCRRLELDPDFLAKTFTCRLAHIPDLTGGGWSHAFNNFHGGCLASAVRAQQAEAGGLSDRKAYVVYGDDTGVMLDEIASLEGRRHEQASLEP